MTVKIRRQLILAPFIVIGVIWIILSSIALSQTNRFPDHKTRCMYVYWAATWPVWKFVVPDSWFGKYVIWTADHCDN